MGAYEYLIPRIEGRTVESDIEHHLDLVRRGVAGFIVFGAELGSLRRAVEKFQAAARLPLIICSDLEQGLGQQVEGGTLFPPAMAIGRCASRMDLLEAAWRQMAHEAAHAGINTILAPVLDVHTNPLNPIIATRAFSSDPQGVAALGAAMVRVTRECGVATCGKHFPGHGDTALDSHLTLPTVDKGMEELKACELVPFRAAVEAGVDSIMLGHLLVPAMDPSGLPASVSKPIVRYLREEMGFNNGIVMTDALNMGGLGGLDEARAARMALEAGVDILLHPVDPERLAHALDKGGAPPVAERLSAFRRSLISKPADAPPPDDLDLPRRLTELSILRTGAPRPLRAPFVVLLGGREAEGRVFMRNLVRRFPIAMGVEMRSEGKLPVIPPECDLIVAVFGGIRAFSGGPPEWLIRTVASLAPRAHTLVAFGQPALIDQTGDQTGRIGDCGKDHASRIYAYQSSVLAEESAAQCVADGR